MQVTLQILEALIEKNPKDLPLFATSVLKILDLVLKSNDITMVESSTPTFEAFCANHDASSLSADQAYMKQYESIVRQYASLASTRSSPGKTQPSKPVAMRWRNTGLEAIRSVASSDALASVSGRQYEVIVPMILENLWTDNEDFLEVLLQRAQVEEKVDAEKLLRRRTSVATVRTADTAVNADPNPIALSGTAMDVDKLAEEDIGVLAMVCLKQIYVAPNRSQIHAATQALLTFIEERVVQEERVVKTNAGTGRDGGWAIKVFGLISRWAPVQERYVILVTTMDTLVRMPLSDDTLPQHIVLVAMMGSLLRSDVNLIGLSVMDVLLSLMQHMKRLVQLPGDPSGAREAENLVPGKPDPRSAGAVAASTAAELCASRRKELLGRIQQTIGDLATHVYYADQISDMISAILLRLRPTRSGSPASSSPQGEKAEGQTGSLTNLADDGNVESLFSLTVAKTAALKAIKSILLVANPRTKMAGNLGLARSKVPIQVWEGTQWLLRDPDGHVRKAYADAVVLWLDRETTKRDLRAKDESAPNPRHVARSSKEAKDMLNVAPARRAASSASTRKEAKPPRSHFLKLLHVAIYDNALQYLDYETDLVLLHILLAKLVSQLGINAVRYGLPMIFRLQEDIQDVETPICKVRLGSLVHGYLWLMTDQFDFENSIVGRAIHNEISRRRSKNFWVEGIHVPAPLLELVGTPGLARPQPKMPLHRIESEALLPFDDRFALIECICAGYQETMVSPPGSPAASPGRSFTHPISGQAMSPVTEADREVPARFREDMCAEWSRDLVIAQVREGSKSASLNGSRTGTMGTAGRNNRLAAAAANGSPAGSQNNLRPQSQPAPQNGGLMAPAGGLRKSSLRSNLTPSPDSSTVPHGGVTSVDQLKMVLSGHAQASNLRGHTSHGAAGAGDGDDNSTDSMVSCDYAPSELSFNPPQTSSGAPPRTRDRSQSRDRKNSSPNGSPRSNGGDNHQFVDGVRGYEDGQAVPPVPPLPKGVSPPPTGGRSAAARPSTSPQPQEAPVLPPITQDRSAIRPAKTRSVKSRGGADHRPFTSAGGFGVGGFGEDVVPMPALDLNALLSGIDSKAGEHSLGNVARPPY